MPVIGVITVNRACPVRRGLECRVDWVRFSINRWLGGRVASQTRPTPRRGAGCIEYHVHRIRGRGLLWNRDRRSKVLIKATGESDYSGLP